MNSLISILLLSLNINTIFSSGIHHVRLHQEGDRSKACLIISESENVTYKDLNSNDVNALSILSKPAISSANDNLTKESVNSNIIELYSYSKSIIDAHIQSICSKVENLKPLSSSAKNSNDDVAINAPDVRKIVDNGDAANRIDVVFMGDGYTASEKTKFFSDISRLTTDMFEGPTFKSWLPLFNIWAIHVESVDSGIGYNGAKNTPFKLYREAGQLRAIFTGNSNYARQICQLTGSNACDYPSLIANDDYYGGLGGEFVISTKSARTGTVVLRHEMGHNFVSVGEEYDNGQVYSGVNAATSINTGWKNWISGPVREEKAIYRLLEYPWHNLANGQKSFTFTSDGKFKRWYLLTSVTAAGEANSLEFVLDGKVLPWQARGSDDREFYDWRGEQGFTAGTHTLTVRSKTASTNQDIPRMIASVTLHEFGDENEFKIANDNYSAYPTWDVNRRKTYRPTNAGCLMRNMTHNSFCNVCKEGMWFQFLKRISLIDGVKADKTKISLSTLKIGQFRTPTPVPGEKLSITWTLNNQVQTQFKDQLEILNPSSGSWSVTVEFISPEIRTASTHTKDVKSFTV
ncbi:hypothetical protein K502DRAFT_353517 [Neoconidiobolus thromboides FSU 785]|nr:hypothetical protein K502DRAFT_353517 [Neoconidiobolus thromboides FSU 785]